MFPFCLIFEVINFVPWKKMGLKLMKVPDILYTNRIGSDVIIPVVLFGENREEAFKRCVKMQKTCPHNYKIQTAVFYPLLRICIAMLTSFFSYLIMNNFTSHPNIPGVNSLFENFHHFELVVIFFFSFFLTFHFVDILQTTFICCFYYETELQEVNRRLKSKINIVFPDYSQNTLQEVLHKDLFKAPEQLKYYENFKFSHFNFPSRPFALESSNSSSSVSTDSENNEKVVIAKRPFHRSASFS